MTATLSADDTPPTLPAAGALYGLLELATTVATAIRLEKTHRAMIARLEVAILKRALDAADSARRAGPQTSGSCRRRNWPTG